MLSRIMETVRLNGERVAPMANGEIGKGFGEALGQRSEFSPENPISASDQKK